MDDPPPSGQGRVARGLPAVSTVGLGMAALGRPGYINLGHGDDIGTDRSVGGLRRRTWAVLDEARSRGITYLDCARSYGRSEEFVAGWLRDRRIPPGEIVVGSKWGYVYTADWRVDADTHEVKIHTRENLERQLLESVDLLGDRLGLYQIHSATRESGVLDDRSVLDRLAQLRSSGIRIGASVSGPDQPSTIRRIVEAEIDGDRLFDAVQATWNLLEPSAGPALAEAHDAGVSVIVKEAVANGRLTGRDADVAARLGPLPDGRSLDAVAIAAALAQPWATVVLSGAATVEQLRSNLSAHAVPTEVLDRLPGIAETPDAYWSRRGDLEWR